MQIGFRHGMLPKKRRMPKEEVILMVVVVLAALSMFLFPEIWIGPLERDLLSR
jgi:hypothetical protein